MNRYSRMDLPVKPTLFFEFHGLSDAAVALQVEAAREIVAEHNGSAFARAVTADDRAALWQARHDAYFAALALRPGSQSWTTDVCVPISRLADCIRETKADIASSTLAGPLVGHVGDGNFHIIFPVRPDDAGEIAEAARLTDRDGRARDRHGWHVHGRARRRNRQTPLHARGARRGGGRDDAGDQAARSIPAT